MTTEWEPGAPIGYINLEIPEFDNPPYKGESYGAMVPDTLDLAERARSAIHAMTELTNPDADCEPYVYVNWTPTPVMDMDLTGHDQMSKLQEAVVLNRIMSGSVENIHVDVTWMEVTLKNLGTDGLIHTPTWGRPWAFKLWDSSEVAGNLSGNPDHRSDQLISPSANGQFLRTLSLYAARDGTEFWQGIIRGVINGLSELAIYSGDYAYYWPSHQSAVKHPPSDVKPLYHYHMIETSRVLWGLTCAYKAIGYEPALSLAGHLSAFYRDTFFTRDGGYITAQIGAGKAHVHGHARTILGMTEYALLTGDQELLEFAINSYEWVRSKLDVMTGYVPNLVPCSSWERGPIDGEMDTSSHDSFVNDSYNGCEIMGLADIIGIALVLSDAGISDYWDDVDRWTRNMLADSQILESDWVYHLPGSRRVSLKLSPGQSIDRVAERCLGSWSSNATPNDWYEGLLGTDECKHGDGFIITDTAGAGRCLYWIWDRIVNVQDGKLRVNLLLNRASRWADIDSYIPYEGRVEIRVKRSGGLAVRIPEWVQPAEVMVEVDNATRNVGWSGRYAEIGDVQSGQMVRLCFPMVDRRDGIFIQKKKYNLVRRGNEVVKIYPRGKYYPFYQRQAYMSGEPRWRKVRRFVSGEEIDW